VDAGPDGSTRNPGTPVKSSDFLRAVGVLAGSAVIAHGITAACLPLLSRLYTPAEFSVLALFAGVASVFSAVVALRFDIAIPIPPQDSVAINLLALSLGIAAALSVLLALVIWLLPDRVVALSGQPMLADVLWLLPVAAFSASASSALQSWFIRRKQFPALVQLEPRGEILPVRADYEERGGWQIGIHPLKSAYAPWAALPHVTPRAPPSDRAPGVIASPSAHT